MRRCLEAIVSGRFIDDNLLHTLTGWKAAKFGSLLERFDDVASPDGSATEDDFEVIFQAVMQLCNYPVDHLADMEALLGVPCLHLAWFWYKLMSIRDRWSEHAADDANQARRSRGLW